MTQITHYVGPTLRKCYHLAVFDSLTGVTAHASDDSPASPPAVRYSLRPGDFVVFFKGVFGDTSTLEWTRLSKIEVSTSEDGSSVFAFTGTEAYPVDHGKRIAIYRHDSSGMLCDVTRGLFVWLDDVDVTPGQMLPGTYFTSVDRMKNSMNRRQNEVNAKLAASDELRNLRVPLTAPSTNTEDVVSTAIMERIKARYALNIEARYSPVSSPPPSSLHHPSPRTQDIPINTQALNRLIPAKSTQIDEPLPYWNAHLAPLIGHLIDTSQGDRHAHACITRLVLAAPRPMFTIVDAFKDLSTDEYDFHPDDDAIYALSQYGKRGIKQTVFPYPPLPAAPGTPSTAQILGYSGSTYGLPKEIHMEVIDKNSPSRGALFPLPPNILQPLVALIGQGEARARPVHPNFPYLHHAPVENMNPDIEGPLATAISEFLQELGYNTTKKGVRIEADRLFTVEHAIMDSHTDVNSALITPQAIAVHSSFRGMKFEDVVPFIAVIPGSQDGASLLVWPPLKPGETSCQSIAVHVKFGDMMVLRAEFVHAGSFGLLAGSRCKMPRLHLLVYQKGGFSGDRVPTNYYSDPAGVPFVRTRLLTVEHQMWFPRQTRRSWVGGEIVSEDMAADDTPSPTSPTTDNVGGNSPSDATAPAQVPTGKPSTATSTSAATAPAHAPPEMPAPANSTEKPSPANSTSATTAPAHVPPEKPPPGVSTEDGPFQADKLAPDATPATQPGSPHAQSADMNADIGAQEEVAVHGT